MNKSRSIILALIGSIQKGNQIENNTLLWEGEESAALRTFLSAKKKSGGRFV